MMQNKEEKARAVPSSACGTGSWVAASVCACVCFAARRSRAFGVGARELFCGGRNLVDERAHVVETSQMASSVARPRALLLWERAAPRSAKQWHGYCRGPGQQGGVWKGSLSARLDECPPLLWGNGTFTIDSVHAQAPALSALVELVEPSFGAVVQNSVLEVVGYETGAPH